MTAVATTLHADEVPTDEHLVRRLLADQFPQWAGLPVRRHSSTGSDHVLYRLGDNLVVRMPRQPGVDRQVDKEGEWLPRLAPCLPVAVPVPVARGEPGEGYPFGWSVYRWLDGEDAPDEGVDDPALAEDLARFVNALWAIDTTGAPRSGRGVPLATRDEPVRAAIAELDAKEAVSAWERALEAPEWEGPPVWVHGDLAGENVLLREGRLAAVIDFGVLGTGDPAVDLIAAWSILAGGAREVFHAAAGVDDATWERGKGWALSTGLIALPYYAATHPPRAANARYRIAQVLADG
jgi:aminoglycoside phosphotransferase (APT) family kinase protein